jgi:hypothetical protein
MTMQMTDDLRNKTVEELKELERQLFSSNIQLWFENNGTIQEQDNFNARRVELSVKISKLDAIRIEKIADKLNKNNSEFQKAIKDLSETIKSINSAIDTLSQLSTLTKIIGNIISIV